MFNETCACGCQSGYFFAIGLSSVKRLQIGTDVLLIITNPVDVLFSGINIDDLE